MRTPEFADEEHLECRGVTPAYMPVRRFPRGEGVLATASVDAGAKMTTISN